MAIPWWIIGALLLLAVSLSMIARGMSTLAIDREATITVQRLDGEPWRALAWIGNAFGFNPATSGLAVILLLAAVFRQDVRGAAFLVLLVSFRALANGLKPVFDSPRPTADVAEILASVDGLGFPSGHAMSSAVLFGGLTFLAIRQFGWCGPTRYAPGVAIAGVALTGYARIWVGAHWLTDVIGGAIYGLAIVLVAANVSLIIESWVSRHRDHDRRAPM
jgi:undecaprenyl-diphosphatase